MSLRLYSIGSHLSRHAEVTGSSPVGTSYNSPQRKAFRRKWGAIPKYIQDHHVIPKQWRRHPTVLRFGLDINSSENIIMMPTQLGMFMWNLRQCRYKHDGGHHYYNIYVKEMLDSMEGITCEKCFRDEFLLFLVFLKITLRRGDEHIPWI